MVRIGIIGTGGMARQHALEFAKNPAVKIVAACDVDAARVAAFNKQHGIANACTSAAELLARADVDAVSIVTPDSTHCALSIQALEAGKHVLCEKPLATCHADALRMVAAARKAGTITMVNFSYRNSSAIHRAAEMVRNGDLGTIYHVEAHYLQSWLVNNDWGVWQESPGWLWRLSTAHGSKGVLGDVGVHLLDFASYPVGPVASVRCHLKTFDKAPGGKVRDYTLDANDSAYINVEFASGAVGSLVTTRLAQGHMNSVWLAIHGSKGAVRIDLDRSYEMLERCRPDAQGRLRPWEYIDCGRTPSIYERFVTSVETGVNDQPDFARGAHIQDLLDSCEQSQAQGAGWVDIAPPVVPANG